MLFFFSEPYCVKECVCISVRKHSLQCISCRFFAWRLLTDLSCINILIIISTGRKMLVNFVYWQTVKPTGIYPVNILNFEAWSFEFFLILRTKCILDFALATWWLHRRTVPMRNIRPIVSFPHQVPMRLPSGNSYKNLPGYYQKYSADIGKDKHTLCTFILALSVQCTQSFCFLVNMLRLFDELLLPNSAND